MCPIKSHTGSREKSYIWLCSWETNGRGKVINYRVHRITGKKKTTRGPLSSPQNTILAVGTETADLHKRNSLTWVWLLQSGTLKSCLHSASSLQVLPWKLVYVDIRDVPRSFLLAHFNTKNYTSGIGWMAVKVKTGYKGRHFCRDEPKP